MVLTPLERLIADVAPTKVLATSISPQDRALGKAVANFVNTMPQPDSQRLTLARELRAANRAASLERNTGVGGKDRTR